MPLTITPDVNVLVAASRNDHPHQWPTLRQLCLEKNLTANAIPDAWLTAAVIQLGEHLVRFDANFKKLLRGAQFTVLVAP